MTLDGVEVNALRQLFKSEENGFQSVIHCVSALNVVERSTTSVGFYSLIHGASKAAGVALISERIWHFRMGAKRGYFVCWSNDDGSLLLEGVALSERWPDPEDWLPMLSRLAKTTRCGATRVWTASYTAFIAEQSPCPSEKAITVPTVVQLETPRSRHG